MTTTMMEQAAEMYIRQKTLAAYVMIVYIIITIIISIILIIKRYIEKRRLNDPLHWYLSNPVWARNCLEDKDWVEKNPNLARKLRSKLK